MEQQRRSRKPQRAISCPAHLYREESGGSNGPTLLELIKRRPDEKPKLKKHRSHRKLTRRTSSRSRIDSKAEKWIRTAESSEMGITGLPLPSPQQSGDGVLKSRQVVYYQAGPILFTAPHSIRLKRDGENDHRVEPLTKDLVKILTVEFGYSKASAIIWKNDAEQCYDTNRDPNYLKREELKSNPWHRFLKNHHQRHGAIAIHFDIHGMNGKRYGSDLALGYEPIHRFQNDASFQNLPINVEKLLKPMLASKGFTLKEVATMTGYRSPSRLTLSQQSVEICKSAAIQIEMSMKLRVALVKDVAFRKKFRECLQESYSKFLDEQSQIHKTTISQLRLQCSQRKKMMGSGTGSGVGVSYDSDNTNPSSHKSGNRSKNGRSKSSSFLSSSPPRAFSSSSSSSAHVRTSPSILQKIAQSEKKRKQKKRESEKSDWLLHSSIVRFIFCLPSIESEPNANEERIKAERLRLRNRLKGTTSARVSPGE